METLSRITGERAAGVALDRDDNPLFAMTYKDVVAKNDNARVYWQPKGKAEAKTNIFDKPEGIAVSEDKLFVAIAGGKKILGIDFRIKVNTPTFVEPYTTIATDIEGLRSLAAAKEDVYWVSTTDKCIGRKKNSHDPDKKFISGIDNPMAVAVDSDNRDLYVADSSESSEHRHIGRYSTDGIHLSDLYAKGMRDSGETKVVLKDVFVDNQKSDKDVVVLQNLVGGSTSTKVWRYSNVFAK